MSQAQSKAQETVNPHNSLLRQNVPTVQVKKQERGSGALPSAKDRVRIQTQGCLVLRSLGFFHSALVTSSKGHSPAS